MKDKQIMDIMRFSRNITYIGDNIYTIEYTDDYYLDNVLKLNNASYSDVLKYISKQKNISTKHHRIKKYNKGYTFNIESALKVQSLAHNFDAQDGPCVVLWTSPENGLRSMSLVNPNILFNKLRIKNNTIKQKDILNAMLAPYVSISGVNEAGIAVVGVPVEGDIVKQKRGKNVISPYIAIRAILDKCKTIEEAIDFLKSYDMHETNALNFNYQILDSEGKCILVEYANNNINIIQNSKSDDFVLVNASEGKEYSEKIDTEVTSKNGTLKTNEIMDLLSATAHRYEKKIFKKPIYTLWSAIYRCNLKTLSLCFRMNYDIIYKFSLYNPGEYTKRDNNSDNPIVNPFDITSNDYNVILKANNIYKTYGVGGGQVHALNDINLKIRRGELLVIIGNSGSGKSTLLNILGGMDRPDRGKIFLEGIDISNFDDDKLAEYRKKNIGYIFQSFNLINDLTAIENVALSLDEENKQKALSLLDIVGLKEKANVYPSNLSGGEQQRISIARSLATNPKILFCDEPTGSLDYQTGKQILIELEKMAREKEQTVVIVTHTREIGKMADRVIYMKNGKIEDVVTNKKPISAEKIEW